VIVMTVNATPGREGKESCSLATERHTALARTGRFLRDEKASSGLALKPTDLSALLTEQIAHLRPFLIVFATPSDQRGKPTYRAFLRKLTHWHRAWINERPASACPRRRLSWSKPF
jgi:hypothetical protein